MKKTLASLALGGTILLGGCGTTGGIATTLAQIQAVTAQICGFIPTAIQVADLFPGLNVYVGNATSIAVTICTAVGSITPPASLARKRLAASHAVTNVTIVLPDGRPAVISGYFVR